MCVCACVLSVPQKPIQVVPYMCSPPPLPDRAMEQFTRRFPHHVNLKKDDGYTALHLSALNDHLDLVTMLAELVR